MPPNGGPVRSGRSTRERFIDVAIATRALSSSVRQSPFNLQTSNFKPRPKPSASKAEGLAACSQLGKYSHPLGGMLFLGNQPLDEVLVEPLEPRGNTAFGIV